MNVNDRKMNFYYETLKNDLKNKPKEVKFQVYKQLEDIFLRFISDIRRFKDKT